MALVTDKLIFLHIPKCAGVFIRSVFDECKIKYEEIGEQHSHFPYLLNFRTEEYFNKKFIFAFVRHPLTWYQSRWAFRIKHGWRMQHPLDYHCASNNFHTFVSNIISYKPYGWVTCEYCNYIDTIYRKIDYVGKVENLVVDITTALTRAGEKFDPEAIKSVPRINDSDIDGKSSKYWAKYTPELINRVLAADAEIIRRYYSDYKIKTEELI